jgi:hypothetical protein
VVRLGESQGPHRVLTGPSPGPHRVLTGVLMGTHRGTNGLLLRMFTLPTFLCRLENTVTAQLIASIPYQSRTEANKSPPLAPTAAHADESPPLAPAAAYAALAGRLAELEAGVAATRNEVPPPL